MPHKSFKVIGSFVSEEKIFKRFYHMAVVALWVMSPERFGHLRFIFSFSPPTEALCEISL